MATFNEQRAEELFGSDACFGVQFEDPQGTRYTLDEGRAMLADASTCPDLLSVFPDGTSATVCTNYARHIAAALPGRARVFGFYEEDNPASRIAQIAGGHDFAIVDGRYIVDPWVRLVEGESDRICFDLAAPGDAAEILRLYGPRERWDAAQT
ncbi:hypothetical protein KDX23_07600 [Burkholderia vietnamiensis]|uniref:hypothetical protein n=1 Tax=Burkholderia vietnamiensis TaxID=60552 RepID=UPI001B90B11E|nr:hypothetical protein [Burkholderia vietnamiensis]MBR8082609.1 hypothetical protein [Burkholderia vietnamiensis]